MIVATSDDARRRAEQLMAALPPQQHQAIVDAIRAAPSQCCVDRLNPPTTRAIRYTQRLADAGAIASVGSRGDSYDNALAEAFNTSTTSVDHFCGRR